MRHYEKNGDIYKFFLCLYITQWAIIANIGIVPDHVGGRPCNINAWFLNTHMVYL